MKNLSTALSPKLRSLLYRELVGAFRRLDLAIYLAWSDTQTRYKRSFLGPFWLVLGTAIGVTGLGYVWSILFKIDRATLLPSLTISLVSWYLISSCITESASVFYTHRSLILHMPFSSFMISLLLLLRHVINFGHNFVVIFAVLALYPLKINPYLFLFIPGFFLVCLNLLWLIHLMGYIGARYRDLSPLVTAIMPIIFFLTPILFHSKQLGSHSFIADFNPVALLLILIRDPLLGTSPPAFIWVTAFLMALIGWSAALFITAYKRDRLPYWVH